MSNADEIEDSSAPLIEHLTELRTRLIRSVLAFIVGMVICFTVWNPIFNFLTHPLCDAMALRGHADCGLILIKLQEGFFVAVSISLLGGLILSFPFISYQLWRFVAPGQGLGRTRALPDSELAGPELAGPKLAGPKLAGPELAGPQLPSADARQVATELPCTVGSGLIRGVESIPVSIEATLKGEAGGPPRLLGQVEGGIREACFRVLNAFPAQGLPPPRNNPLLNFVPAGLRKVGSHFDLPMALALAGASGLVDRDELRDVAAFGELTMRGDVLGVGGTFTMTEASVAVGRTRILCAPGDAERAALATEATVYAVRNLATAIALLRGATTLAPALPHRPPGSSARTTNHGGADLSDLRGLETAKRALLVAATGGHDILLRGSPGSGKSALSRLLVGLLPAPSPEEAQAILRIADAWSSTVLPSTGGPADHRPFRAPHHTCSTASLLGGGPDPRPGEITLAHHGVLFLDELAEFRRSALEGLRQPLEDREVVIGRARRTVRMPADFLLVGAMNPCPCGWRGHPSRPCTCSRTVRDRYLRRISGPLLDRFDVRLVVPALTPMEMDGPRTPPTTAQARAMVESARRPQAERGSVNARLEGKALDRAVDLTPTLRQTLATILERRRESARGRVRILRVARTLADLAGASRIEEIHLLEADRLRCPMDE